MIKQQDRSQIQQTIQALCDEKVNPSKSGGVSLVVKKGRLVGIRSRFRCPATHPDVMEWLDVLANRVAEVDGGYGEVELVIEDGQIVGAEIEFSLSL